MKPDDIPQDVWERAEIAAKEATRQAMRDPLMPYYITVAPYIARAIQSAKAEAYEEAAKCADDPWAHTLVEFPADDQLCEGVAAAIRKIGE